MSFGGLTSGPATAWIAARPLLLRRARRLRGGRRDLAGLGRCWGGGNPLPLIGDTPVGCRCLFGLPPAGSVVVGAGDIIGAHTGLQLTVEAGGAGWRATPLWW